MKNGERVGSTRARCRPLFEKSFWNSSLVLSLPFSCNPIIRSSPRTKVPVPYFFSVIICSQTRTLVPRSVAEAAHFDRISMHCSSCQLCKTCFIMNASDGGTSLKKSPLISSKRFSPLLTASSITAGRSKSTPWMWGYLAWIVARRVPSPPPTSTRRFMLAKSS